METKGDFQQHMTRWVLCILDGFGLSNETSSNGIAQAKTPHLDRLFATYPHTFLQASEEFVGLPKGQMGNSEVGHLTIGAGRIVRQGLAEIDYALKEQTFDIHPKLLEFIQKSTRKRCHLMGLFSDGGVHSHQRHFIKAAECLASHGITVFLHIFTDGRDTAPQSAIDLVKSIPSHPLILPATLQGRFYAMDRDKRWERTQKAYQAIVGGVGKEARSFADAIAQSYTEGIADEFIEPFVIGNYTGVQPLDSLFHVNFRADRVRQLLEALVCPEFDSFERRLIPWSTALGMSNYSETLDPFVPSIYPSQQITDGLCQTLSAQGRKILKIAETEKYAHVTFFFNGGMETPVEGESRILIPSPKVMTYDLAPEMSAHEITKTLCQQIETCSYDLIVVNYANPDMVGHTGVKKAILQAIACIDECLYKLYQQCLRSNYALMITSDHGNAEQMIEDGDLTKPHTAHTCNPVPLLIINYPCTDIHTASIEQEHYPYTDIATLHDGTLADIAPTLLKSMKVPLPAAMTGRCLIDA